MNTTDIVKALRNDCRDCGSHSLCRNGEMNVYCAVRDAADRLEVLQERCARYAGEIAVLRERQKKVEQPGGCAFAPWCDAVREAREKAEGIKTNADRIRAMSDELLAEFLDNAQKMECEAFHGINSDGTLKFESLKNGWFEWLQQPAEGVVHIRGADTPRVLVPPRSTALVVGPCGGESKGLCRGGRPCPPAPIRRQGSILRRDGKSK